MHSAVKNSRNGIRRPPRSLSAPRIGETIALRATLTATAIETTSLPSRSPNRLPSSPTARSRSTRPRTRRSCSRSRTAPRRAGSARPAAGRERSEGPAEATAAGPPRSPGGAVARSPADHRRDAAPRRRGGATGTGRPRRRLSSGDRKPVVGSGRPQTVTQPRVVSSDDARVRHPLRRGDLAPAAASAIKPRSRDRRSDHRAAMDRARASWPPSNAGRRPLTDVDGEPIHGLDDVLDGSRRGAGVDGPCRGLPHDRAASRRRARSPAVTCGPDADMPAGPSPRCRSGARRTEGPPRRSCQRRGARADLRRSAGRLALVAVDLLWLDDKSLCDVPLLERKRILESVLVGVATWSGSGSTSSRRSTPGSGPGGPSASGAWPSRRRTAATSRAEEPALGPAGIPPADRRSGPVPARRSPVRRPDRDGHFDPWMVR